MWRCGYNICMYTTGPLLNWWTVLATPWQLHAMRSDMLIYTVAFSINRKLKHVLQCCSTHLTQFQYHSIKSGKVMVVLGCSTGKPVWGIGQWQRRQLWSQSQISTMARTIRSWWFTDRVCRPTPINTPKCWYVSHPQLKGVDDLLTQTCQYFANWISTHSSLLRFLYLAHTLSALRLTMLARLPAYYRTRNTRC